jgi:predicted 3-demethylubiquinone-9 3-methyltransferase (glyoxalase superfamily)
MRKSFILSWPGSLLKHKDRFGVSWQIVPENMGDLLSNGSREEIKRVTEAFLKMKKLDLAALEKARLGL